MFKSGNKHTMYCRYNKLCIWTQTTSIRQYERYQQYCVAKYTENTSNNEKVLLLVIRNMLTILGGALSLPWSSLAAFSFFWYQRHKASGYVALWYVVSILPVSIKLHHNDIIVPSTECGVVNHTGMTK